MKTSTKTLPIFGIQSQAVSYEYNSDECICYLASGKVMTIKCDGTGNGKFVYQALMFGMVNTDKPNGKDFDFFMKITIE